MRTIYEILGIACLTVASTLIQSASAEVYGHIYPSTQPEYLPQIFPGSTIEKIQVDGQQPFDLNLVITSPSLPLGIMVGFTDWLNFSERVAQNNPSDSSNNSLLEDYRSGKKLRYSLSVVRRITTAEQIPISTLYKLYGQYGTTEINKDTLSEVHYWKKKGVVAEVKNGLVTSIEYMPTTSDKACEPYHTQMVPCPVKVIRKAEQEDLTWEKAKRDGDKMMADKIGAE